MTTTNKNSPACIHCGVPVAPGERFCCAGCAFVYRLIREEGLDAFYQIKDGVTPPADAVLQPARDFAWLAEAQRTAEAGVASELVVAIQGISCAGCVWLIERLFSKQPGAGRIDINAQTGLARMRWQTGSAGTANAADATNAGGGGGRFEAAEFARVLQRFNYLIGPADLSRPAAGTSESRGLVKRIGLCAAFAMNVMLFALPAYFGMEAGFAYARLFETLAMLFATASLAAGGVYFLRRAWRALREHVLHIDLPIALGIAGAYGGSFYGWATANPECQYFDFVSGFILLMLVGRWAQLAAVERNQRRLLREQPLAARVRLLRSDSDVSAESLRIGDVFEIGSGHVVPVESRLLAGGGGEEGALAAFNLAWITGESEPRTFLAGQRVPAGATYAGRTRVRLEAVQTWKGSLLAELMREPERAPARDLLIERVIQGYLIAIIGIAVAAGAAWWWRTGGNLPATGAVVIAILVVSCPCALGLAFPLAEEIATVALRKRGVFIRARDVWTRLRRVRTLAFDKTGTLTLETPVLQNPAALDSLDADAQAALMALTRDNLHPVGRALYEAALVRGWNNADALPGEVREVVGHGVTLGGWSLEREDAATVLRLNVARASRPLVLQNADGPARHEPDRGPALPAGGTPAPRIAARFYFADAARADARTELAALRARGLGVTILSGDSPEKVAALARSLDLPEGAALGGLSPHDKAAWLDSHGAADTLMLGDGANDSLAFDRALCRGTPVIHRGVLGQKADFYYLGRGIAGIRALLEMNDARHRTHLALLVFMILYNLFAVGLAATGHMSPLLAAVLMPLSSLATLGIVYLGLFRRLR
ncbi:heavy metal translocating P-type ATPase [Geminisphaera colitermitum]|uniref:heavy metal translocating P-type ATPase n=1 Tax=Geminisphaera colitermitum TaxID=1148786 RepID=UPI001E42982B|nr:heavy metal translocating P-type ATPase metal-binding domain-containing protein [Geminisphaera colitermitum]